MAIRKVIPRSLDSAAASANLSFDANTLFVDSTNNAVGIGTSSPVSKLQVSESKNGGSVEITAANTYYLSTSTDETVAFQGEFFQNDVSANRAGGYMQIGKSGDFSNNANASAFMLFATRNAGTLAEKMRIDSSGNLLVGTTSAASSQGAKLQVDTSIAARRNIAAVGGPAIRLEKSRATTDGSYTIVANGDTLGEYQFFGADGVQHIIGARVKAVVDGTPGVNDMPSALTFDTTADGAAATTERMRIDSSGNLLVGTTSNTPSSKFVSVGGPVQLSGGTTAQAGLRVQHVSSVATITGINNDNNAFNPIALYTSATEAMRIDTSGNVGIGTSSPAYRLDVGTSSVTGNIHTFGSITSGTLAGYSIRGVPRLTNDTGTFENTYIGCGASVGNIIFQQGNSFTAASNTERMRLDTVGRLMLGYLGTSARASAAKLELKSAVNTALSIYMFKDTQVEVNMGFTGSTDTNFYINSGSTTIGASGVYLTNTGNSWNSVSDERMKTIVEPITNAAEKVSSLRTVIGYYNNDEKQIHRPFLIAQDVQAVLPEAVNVQNADTGTLGMSYTDVIPLLVAAIKEQQVLIAQLQADVAALQAK